MLPRGKRIYGGLQVAWKYKRSTKIVHNLMSNFIVKLFCSLRQFRFKCICCGASNGEEGVKNEKEVNEVEVNFEEVDKGEEEQNH